MSQALERLETERLLAVKEDLTATNYNQLKTKLTELGAGDAWLQGEKKDIIITKALQILEGSAKAPEVKKETPEVKTEVINTEVPKEEEKPIVEPVIEPEVEAKPVETEKKEELFKVDEKEDQDDEEIDEVEEVEEVVKEEVKAVVYGEDDPRNFVSKLTPNLSLADLEKNLDRVQLRMRGASNFHKMIYSEKSKQIEAQIKALIKK